MQTSLGLSVESTDALTDTEDLLDWLRQEPELRGRVRAVHLPPEQGQMGGLMELAVAASAGGGVLTVLASALKTWLSQPRKSGAVVKIHKPDGTKIEIDTKRGTDAEALLKLIQQDLDD